MAFQTKDFLSIVAGMVNRARSFVTGWTDYNIGAVGRTLIEAPASEMDILYQDLRIGLKEAIGTSTYSTFSFDRDAAKPAVGEIRVVVTAAETAQAILAGDTYTEEGGAGLAFVVTTATTIPAGATQADVPVVAVVAGAAGNLPAGTAFTPSSPPDGFVSATAVALFAQGVDQESAASRQLRFQAYLASLDRCSLSAIEYGLRNKVSLTDAAGNVLERIVTVKLVEPYEADANQSSGQVQAFVHNGSDGASPELLAEARRILRGYTDASGAKVVGYKAGGIPVFLQACPEQVVNVTAVATLDPNLTAAGKAAALAAVRTAITDQIAGQEAGDPYLRARSTTLAMAVSGVTNFRQTQPAADVMPGSTTKLKVGTLTLTAAA